MTLIDAHLHLWDLSAVAYPWLTPAAGPIYRTFTPADVEPELRTAAVDGVVLVQAANSAEDTEAMLAVAARQPWVAGVVGWVPLTEPAQAAAALTRYATVPAFTGVRHLIHDEPDPDWVVQPAVVESLRLLAEHDVSFDVVAVLPEHLAHVATLAQAVPELRLVIDHLAKPPIQQRGWQPWADLLAAAAAHPNVYAKISGLNTAADPARWSAADLRPYVEHALAVFGADRLMFGSDWPVALLAGDYQQVLRETLAALQGCDEQQRAAILAGTAARCYRLPPGSDAGWA
ncbi:amidohydrolase family protein [Natronosporangium hydrolyticum]|uniref:Amidohydrolase family protein n=1 Tax=Natronosporangium hydrolyticum TaxID=2811111 RepID=A0A895YEA8_9ACTN|nr:amidohydrolase family protein [Natronosporangium hydrolyticum]QSB13739.1 amidohydrolase family protein [Natronosporangium hydrolyticum]